MSCGRRSALGGAVLVAGALIGVPGVNAQAARPKPLPDLTVSGGAVSLSHGRLVGSFTVRDSGRVKVGTSRAGLSLTVGRRTRSLATFKVSALKPLAKTKVSVSVNEPLGLPAGSYQLSACADTAKTVKESSEHDNCRVVGTLKIAAVTVPGPMPKPSPTATATPASTPSPTPSTTPTAVASAATPTQPQPGTVQKPTAPMTIDTDTATLVQDSYEGVSGSYYVITPPKYDQSGNTPMRLLVWMHGCGGDASGDAYETTSSNTLDSQGNAQLDDSRDFIAISIGGADGGCWNPDTDVEKVLVAIADVTTHFDIDRRHIFIGGYSSGGDLAYRTIFYNADEFAGILTVNTHPFRDTGSTEAQSLDAAAWKFNIAHVAHSGDTEYHAKACSMCLNGDTQDDPGVTPAMNDLSSAGYNVEYTIEPGTHSDEDDFQNGTGTDYDWRQYVRPYIDNATWTSPG